MNPHIDSLRAQLRALRAQHQAGQLDAAAWEAARVPLERQLADAMLEEPAARPPRPSRMLLAACTAFVLAVAGAGYALKGSPGAVVASAPAAPQGEVTEEQVLQMVEKLAARMEAQPDDVTGWTMLGRSYMVLEQPAKAQAAFERARRLQPEDPSILADLADATALVQGRRVAGEPERLVLAALKINPDHVKALALAGTAAYERQDYAAAARMWDRVAALEPADSPIAAQARSSAEEARRLAGPGARAPAMAAPGAAASSPPPAGGAAAAASVSGSVSLAASLKERARPDDTVFVFVRAAQGSRMPLAIVRHQVRELPLRFTLDERHAMAAGAGLVAGQTVVVGARVSRSGQALAQPGDLEGLSGPVPVGTRDLRIEISTVLP
ncbi:MAG: c-type cytochrome biogenesis protein CcmI [Rubrivivax sp.]